MYNDLQLKRNRNGFKRLNSNKQQSALQRRPADLGSMSAEGVLAMQQTVGNQSVGNLLTHNVHTAGQTSPIQAKMTINPPGDKYEREADQVARQVVNDINQSAADSGTQVQREAEESEDEELQMKPAEGGLTIQREAEESEDEELQMKPSEGGLTIQREADESEDEELQMKPDGGMSAGPKVESAIQNARGGGGSMDDSIRMKMEGAFNTNFDGVKIHANSDIAPSIGARAFTTGKDIFFGNGQYNPTSESGQELLAHELTHVVQQNGK